MEIGQYIMTALKNGCRILSNSSSQCVRMLFVIRKEKEVAYGAGANLNEAFEALNEDLYFGGRDHEKVYGVTRPKYLTGAREACSFLDFCVKMDHDFILYMRGDGKYTIEIHDSSGSPVEKAPLLATGTGKSVEEAISAAKEQSGIKEWLHQEVGDTEYGQKLLNQLPNL